MDESQKKLAYSAFLNYQDYCLKHSLWDDSDRVLDLLTKRLDLTFHERGGYHYSSSKKKNVTSSGKSSSSTTGGGVGGGGILQVQKSSPFQYVYVDEVQDFSLVELAMVYLLCETGRVFLAGDPAQSVVEGLSFCFEEVRSLIWHLVGRDSSQVPKRADQLCRNFRSHSGILNVSSSVLRLLLETFPRSSNSSLDLAMFEGPRPGFIIFPASGGGRSSSNSTSSSSTSSSSSMRSPSSLFKQMIRGNNKIVILTTPENVKRLQQEVGLDQLVFSIQEAKGLEFSEVFLVDFFLSQDQNKVLQKSWNQILREQGTAGKGQQQQDSIQSNCPELEGILKLLYTGITRCVQRLIFVETSESLTGKRFLRWLTRKGLVEEFSVDLLLRNEEEGDVGCLMTSNEWCARGVDFALQCEENWEESHFVALGWLKMSIQCFEKAGDHKLIEIAKTQFDARSFCDLFSTFSSLSSSSSTSPSPSPSLSPSSPSPSSSSSPSPSPSPTTPQQQLKFLPPNHSLQELEQTASNLIYRCLLVGLNEEGRNILMAFFPYLSVEIQQIVGEILDPFLV